MISNLKVLDSTVIESKINKVEALIGGKKALVAFSGGVDSSVVALLAKQFCEDVILVLQTGPSVAGDEEKFAINQAQELNLRLHIIEYDETTISPHYTSNPTNRCYYCKDILYSEIEKFRCMKGFDLILNGTNFSDLSGHRPGVQAATDWNILSPLSLVELTKFEIRRIAEDASLMSWNKPAMACLASRVMHGISISRDILEVIEQCEKFLKQEFGLKIVRVRHHGALARIELGETDMDPILNQDSFKSIEKKFKDLGYSYVTLDIGGYRPNKPISSSKF